MLSDEELTELGLRSEGEPPSVTHGVAYRIPDDQVQSGACVSCWGSGQRHMVPSYAFR